MATLTFHIRSGNAAFCDPDGKETAETCQAEMVRILRAFVDRLEAEFPFDFLPLRDANGNQVGLAHLIVQDDEFAQEAAG